MKNDVLIMGGVIIGAIVLLTKGKAGSYVGESIGQAVARVPQGIVKGGYEATTDYIDYFNEQGKDNPLHLSNLSWSVWSVGQKFKSLGNDDRWFW